MAPTQASVVTLMEWIVSGDWMSACGHVTQCAGMWQYVRMWRCVRMWRSGRMWRCGYMWQCACLWLYVRMWRCMRMWRCVVPTTLLLPLLPLLLLAILLCTNTFFWCVVDECNNLCRSSARDPEPAARLIWQLTDASLSPLLTQRVALQVLCLTDCARVWISALSRHHIPWSETWKHTNRHARIPQSKCPTMAHVSDTYRRTSLCTRAVFRIGCGLWT